MQLSRSIPPGDVKPLAKALMARFGSLAGVSAASPPELKAVASVGEAATLDLKLLQEMPLRIGRHFRVLAVVGSVFTGDRAFAIWGQ